MKKLLAVILAAALLLCLAACGGGEAEKFTITYEPGSYGSGEVSEGTKTKGQDFTLSSQTFIRDGYIQTGWSTSDGGAKAYDLGDKCTNDAKITLYPFWTEDILPGMTIEFGGINWLVLDVQDGKALIISEDILERRPYNYEDIEKKFEEIEKIHEEIQKLLERGPSAEEWEYINQLLERGLYNEEYEEVTWENCSLRQYLNGEFYNNTFTAAEQARIVATQVKNDDNQWFGTTGGTDTTDKIFLLSLEEAVKYFGDSGLLANRPDALALGINDQYNSARAAYTQSGDFCWWWLRSPGHDILFAAGLDFYSGFAVVIDCFGLIDVRGTYTYGDIIGVRPALWITLE